MGATQQLLDSLFILVLQDWIVGPGDVLLRARPERLNVQVSQKKKVPASPSLILAFLSFPGGIAVRPFNNEGPNNA